ncbi:hypothetical protein IO89_13550 [Epilithonimonas lactis]|uniref:Uncharacterized protein n=1 Tax=Epilithonimonas lactis TaxID=421072 RepID=A0A085BFH9_9FLAO|nr:hypothetical protein IO89_13550 [Epilithonimonas lactis]
MIRRNPTAKAGSYNPLSINKKTNNVKREPSVAANLLGAAKIGFLFHPNIFEIDLEKRAKGESDKPKALIIKSKTKSKTKYGHLKIRATARTMITKNAVDLIVFSSV